MKRLVLPLILVTTALAPSLPAQAAGTLTRAFVSSAGSDTNPCTTAQPCATFAAAYNAVLANGIVAALDPGKYGPLTITGPVTIDGNGWAAITAPSGAGTAGITINANSSDNVILRGLNLDGGGQSNTSGIAFNSGGSLTISGCLVRNMTNSGLVFNSNATSAQTLAVSNSFFINNGSDGIEIETSSSGTITASIDQSEFDGNNNGLAVVGTAGTGAVVVAVTDSVAANNSGSGFLAQSASSHSAITLTLTHAQAVVNASGVGATGNNATLWLAQSTVSGNTTGYSAQSNGTINTYGDSYITDTNNTGSLSAASPGKQ